jgi:hypothetical protein
MPFTNCANAAAAGSAALMLLNSVDFAADNDHLPLHDWKMLGGWVGEWVGTL